MIPNLEIYTEIIRQKEELELVLIDLGVHSKGLSEYMIALENHNFQNLSQWLHITHGIKNLNYDGIVYDAGFFMCEPAYNYEIEKQELYQKLVKEITLFSYIYSGLEGIISELSLNKCPSKNGKINSAAYYLKNSFSEWHIPVIYYDRVLKLCEKMYNITFDTNYKVYNELCNCVSIHGLGLKILYKVRNKIMHGDFFFPEPFDHSWVLPFQPEIINLCSRLALMNIQMLFLAYRKGDYLDKLEIYNSSIFDNVEENEWTVNEKCYLSNFHIIRPNFNTDQLELDLV